MEIEIDPKAIGIFVLIMSFCFIVYGISNYIRIQNTGNIKTVNLEIYQDAECTIPLTKIDWGTVEPSKTYQYTAYVINKGNTNLTLIMITENWNPINAKDSINLTWDKENAILQPNNPMLVVFTLEIASEINKITEFSFDIVIYGN